MQIGKVDLNKQVFIIAEIGNNHEGDFDNAKKLIEEASKTGVDAVKFQSIVPENLVTSDQEARIKQLQRFQFSKEQYNELNEIATNHGMYFMSTPFDLDMVGFLDPMVPAHKISSGDNDYYTLLERIAETNKPIIMSSGMSDMNVMSKSIKVLENTWAKSGRKADDLMCILHCVSNYPTLPEHAELNSIPFMNKQLPGVIGYSDHTIGIEASVAAVTLGARVIEKHFTLDNNFSDFRDHQVAADPSTMKALVSAVRNIEQMLGNEAKQVAENEVQMNLAARRSIATANDLKAGDIITQNDLTYLRPGTGIRPGQEDLIVGKKLKKSIAKGLLLQTEDVE